MTYEYEFDHAIAGQKFAAHSAELPYVFGFFPKTGNLTGEFDQTDYRLAELLQTYWANFVKTGNPNSDPLPQWPRMPGRARTSNFSRTAASRSPTIFAMPSAAYRKIVMPRMGRQER